MRTSRREFLLAATGAAATGAAVTAVAAPGRGTFGLAYTSFVIRMLRGRDVLRQGNAAGLPADTLLELCRTFRASGCQMDIGQLGAAEPAALAQVRARAEEQGLYVELSVPARTLEDEAAFARAAEVSRALGVRLWRVALLSGRRYEDFKQPDTWEAFDARWRAALPRAAQWLQKAGIVAGIENHKDYTAPELADRLQKVGNPHLGACVDFGNNVSLLEDPLFTAQTLAPFAVSTHLKDMAVRPYERGFELSEVPLGEGFLPLPRIVEVLRRAHPDLHFCLEMITRDPLKVPYLDDVYWVTYGGRDPSRVERFQKDVLAKAWSAPLPRITGLSPEAMLAAEDENVRKCAAYAKGTLGL
jgi:sugar phosphate isomerase/epimerase